MSDLKIQIVPVSALVSDPSNVRKHDERNIDAIRKSLEAFGQRKPLVVARGNNDELVVIAGNGTLEAAKSLEWEWLAITEVPRDWDADRARAYAIADNRTAELADWDNVKLADALLELDAVGFEPAVMGFAVSEREEPEDEGPLNFIEERVCECCGQKVKVRG